MNISVDLFLLHPSTLPYPFSTSSCARPTQKLTLWSWTDRTVPSCHIFFYLLRSYRKKPCFEPNQSCELLPSYHQLYLPLHSPQACLASSIHIFMSGLRHLSRPPFPTVLVRSLLPIYKMRHLQIVFWNKWKRQESMEPWLYNPLITSLTILTCRMLLRNTRPSSRECCCMTHLYPLKWR